MAVAVEVEVEEEDDARGLDICLLVVWLLGPVYSVDM